MYKITSLETHTHKIEISKFFILFSIKWRVNTKLKVKYIVSLAITVGDNPQR
jgi:hypothetical protein